MNGLTLRGRLGIGWAMIDAERDPERKRRLEDHWLKLLKEYEAECDEQAARGADAQEAA